MHTYIHEHTQVMAQKQNTDRKRKNAGSSKDVPDITVDEYANVESHFQRTDIRNTDDVDIKALMHNKTAYYELAHTCRESITEQPDMLVGGTLRQYQMQGLQWLVSLYNNNLSGVLADEMVGKIIICVCVCVCIYIHIGFVV